jgi:hypothetical protein
VLEEFAQTWPVFHIDCQDAFSDEPPGLARPDANDLTRVALLKVRDRVVTGHSGDAGDEKG